ncbi:hypothetical protein A2380_02390 [candidate division WWE3 bacterium RIFOXYB1_FULL_43_24]|nr:MAG: hypothetical protein A2380_02390 [candidate division WWE3 bacterium RIFOXYB1_FULL_43_24]OGC72674.1 MAG: hypothetical protein A2414_03130 [candidate division WWE3 bacterium RIFOXYC1_FULL_42_13]
MGGVNKKEETGLKFECPKCGKIPQEQVMFLCNTCRQEDLVEKEGLFICPSCLVPGENFECSGCGSKEVRLLS